MIKVYVQMIFSYYSILLFLRDQEIAILKDECRYTNYFLQAKKYIKKFLFLLITG